MLCPSSGLHNTKQRPWLHGLSFSISIFVYGMCYSNPTVHANVVIRCRTLPRANGSQSGVAQDRLVDAVWRELLLSAWSIVHCQRYNHVNISLNKFPFVSFGNDFAVERSGCVRHLGCMFVSRFLQLFFKLKSKE